MLVLWWSSEYGIEECCLFFSHLKLINSVHFLIQNSEDKLSHVSTIHKGSSSHRSTPQMTKWFLQRWCDQKVKLITSFNFILMPCIIMQSKRVTWWSGRSWFPCRNSHAIDKIIWVILIYFCSDHVDDMGCISGIQILVFLCLLIISFENLTWDLISSCTFIIQVAGRLAEFRELVKEVVRSACRTALLEAGFTPDDYFTDTDTPAGGKDTLC